MVMVWGPREVVGRGTLDRLAHADEEALDFSLLLSALGPAGLRPLSSMGGCPGFVPKCLSEPVWEGGVCVILSVFCFFFHTEKQNKKAQNQALRCPGHGPAGFLIEPGLLGRPHPPPQQLLPCGDKPEHTRAVTVASVDPTFVTTAVSSSLPIMSSRPTGGIRNSKFSKQFQYFQYTLGFL